MAFFFERIAKSILMQILKKATDKVLGHERGPHARSKSSSKNPPIKQVELTKSHPWRLCPIGESWVRTHPLTVPESSLGGEKKTIRGGHCRATSNGKEVCTADELCEIANFYFPILRDHLEAMPIPDALDAPNGNYYDLSIAGWTKFWNETLKPDDPVTPDFVKALISTESDFADTPDVHSKAGNARGLIQITEQTRKILQDTKGELKNYLINMTIEESRHPEVNIAAGIRWLYHKRFLLMNRLKRNVTWEEVGAEYKGIFSDLGKDKKSDEIMKKIINRHQRLIKQRKIRNLP